MLRGQFPLRGYSVRMVTPEPLSSTRIWIWSQKRSGVIHVVGGAAYGRLHRYFVLGLGAYIHAAK